MPKILIEISEEDNDELHNVWKSFNELTHVGRLLKAIHDGEVIEDFCETCVSRNEPRTGVYCRHCYIERNMYEYDKELDHAENESQESEDKE